VEIFEANVFTSAGLESETGCRTTWLYHCLHLSISSFHHGKRIRT